MFLLPPRPNSSSAGARWSVGQPAPPAQPDAQPDVAPAQAQSPIAPTQPDQPLTETRVRQVMHEVLKNAGVASAEPATPQTGWGAFWSGMFSWLRGASGELITAGATVLITLYARELYAQARVPGQKSAHVALDLATPQTEFEKMGIAQLDEELDTLLADFYADEPPSNLEIGQRLQLVLELLFKKKTEQLETISTAIEEAGDAGDEAIVELEGAKGKGIEGEIGGIREEWDEVTEHIRNLMHEDVVLQKFRDVQPTKED